MRKGKIILPLFYMLVHAVFFMHLYMESENTTYLLGLVLLPCYLFLPFEIEKIKYKLVLVNILIFGIGFYCTFFFQQIISLVIAACVAPISLFAVELISKKSLNKYETVLYAGCFGGMISPDWIGERFFITILSCVIGGFTFSLFSKSLIGFGGKLGTVGFASVIFWIFIK